LNGSCERSYFALFSTGSISLNGGIFGTLAFQTSDQDLQRSFSQAGTIESASIITDRDTGRSRGFAFVEMATKEEGHAAIERFNEKEISVRSLTVNEARPRESRGSYANSRITRIMAD
jgi:RNA recognition motif-containing protein